MPINIKPQAQIEAEKKAQEEAAQAETERLLEQARLRKLQYKEDQARAQADAIAEERRQAETARIEEAAQQNNPYTAASNPYVGQAIEQNQERMDNVLKYNVDLPPEMYESMNDLLAHAAENGGLQAAEEEVYRMGTAYSLSKMFSLSMDEAVSQLDALRDAVLGAGYTDYKSSWKAIKDNFEIGKNTLTMSDLGKRLREYERVGDKYGAEQVLKAIEDLEAYNATLQDSLPRNFFVEALKAGAETLPYSAAIGIPTMVTALVSPELAPFVGATIGTDLMAGTEYIQLRKAGASPEVSRNVAFLSGLSQAIIEQTLGTVANTAGSFAAATVNKVGVSTLTKKIVDATFRDLALGSRGFTVFAKGLMEYGLNAAEEGIEEMFQEFTSASFQNLAAILSDEDIEMREVKEVWDSACEQFKGAFMGSLVLGIPDAAFSSVATVKDFNAVHDYAAQAQSRETFIKEMEEVAQSNDEDQRTLKGAAVFDGMSQEEVRETAGKIWDNTEDARRRYNEEVIDERARDIQESLASAGGIEETQVNEEGEEILPGDAYRENGRLKSEITTTENADGTVDGVFKVGNPTQQGSNNYGYIKYNLDEENNRVTIDAFKMAPQRENLRSEVFGDFAEAMAGYDIAWDPKSKRGQEIKAMMESINPNGKIAGLNWYSSKDMAAQHQARVKVADEIIQNIQGIRSRDEAMVAVAFFEAMGKKQGLTVDKFYQDYFEGKIFETKDLGAGHAGGMSIRQKDLSEGVRAVVYATEHADLSTWMHEMTHVYRRMFLAGEDLAKVEAALGVKDGKWTREAEEEFARQFEQAVKDGKIQNSIFEKIFQAIADFIASVWHYIKDGQIENVEINPALLEAYQNMLEGGDNVLKDADRAVAESILKSTKVDTQEETSAARSTVAESMEQADDATEAKVRGILDGNAQEENADFNFTLEEITKQEAESIIQDEATSLEEKSEAALDAAAAAEDAKASAPDFDIFQDLYQFVGQNLVKDSKSLAGYKLALEILAAQRGEKSEELLAQAIKESTGWDYFNGKLWYDVEVESLMFNEDNQRILAALKKNTHDAYRGETVLIGDLFNPDAAIFKAVPALKRIKVKFAWNEDLKLQEVYSPATNEIIVNMAVAKGTEQASGVKGAIIRGMQEYINELYKLPTLQRKEKIYLARSLIDGIKNPTLFEEVLDKMRGLESNVLAREAALRTTPQTMDRKSRIILQTPILGKDSKYYEEYNAVLFQNGELTAAEKEVEERFKDTPAMLKAPNGAPSNLSYRQWLQVRTPAFKAWFGDWENDPENSSKVVDKNGEPLVVYHGSRTAGFTAFDDSEGKKSSQAPEGTTFFTSDRDVAKSYSGSGNAPDFNAENSEDYEPGIYECYLNIREPYQADFEGASWDGFAYGKYEIWQLDEAGMRDELVYGPKGNRLWDSREEAESYAESMGINYDLQEDPYLEGSTNDLVQENMDWTDGVIIYNVNDSGSKTGYENDAATDFVIYEGRQVKSATNNNGNFNPDEEDILFQDDHLFSTDPNRKETTLDVKEEERKRAYEYIDNLEDTVEAERIRKNLDRLKNTKWAPQALKALACRQDLKDILAGKEIPEWSLFNKDSACMGFRDALKKEFTSKGVTRNYVFKYVNWDTSLLGHASKPVNAISSSLVNCNPSLACANFCYVVDGQKFPLLTVRREVINWMMDTDPEYTAYIAARQYKKTPEYGNGRHLRLLDTGDLSESWIKFIEEMNKQGIQCQVFSKRPELLSRIDADYNRVLLSVDSTNQELAEQYPKLPLALVYTGATDNSWLLSKETRFKSYGGTILAVKSKREDLQNAKSDVAQLPQWTRPFTCLIDAGKKTIEEDNDIIDAEAEEGIRTKWNCTQCDKFGVGCFYKVLKAVKKDPYDILNDMPDGELKETYGRILRDLGRIRTLGRDQDNGRSDRGDDTRRSLLKVMYNIVNQELQGYDPEGTRSEHTRDYAGNGNPAGYPSEAEAGGTAGTGTEEESSSEVDILHQPAPSMVGVHNLSEAALRHAIKMGGLANPSVAVYDTANGNNFLNYGEITLIAPKMLVNKASGRNAGTFGADIYSPRYPAIKYLFSNENRAVVKNALKDIGTPIQQSILAGELESRIDSNGKLLNFTNSPLALIYLHEKGDDSIFKKDERHFTDEVINWAKSINYEYEGHEKEITDRYIDDLISNYRKNGYSEDHINNLVDMIRSGKAQEADRNGNVDILAGKQFLQRIKRDEDKNGGLDLDETKKAARIKLNENETTSKDFENWARDFLENLNLKEVIFNGFTPSGNRRYMDHTLQNVSKFMKAQGLRGGEGDGMGLGETRAMVAPKFTTLKQIRDNKYRLIDHDTMEKLKEENESEYEEILDLLGEGDAYGLGEARLEEAYSTAGQSPRAMLKSYGVELTEEDLDRIDSFMSKLREMPAEYFETKFERPVELSEFRVAVVPSTIGQDVKDYLERNYLYVKEYENGDDRAKAIQEAIDEHNGMNSNILFQDYNLSAVFNQTQNELIEDAKKYETWQEFMEAYEGIQAEGKKDLSQVPSDANAAWYQTTWELAHGINPTTMDELEAERRAKAEADRFAEDDPAVKDAMFTTMLRRNPLELDRFLAALYNAKEARIIEEPQDESEVAYNENLAAIKDSLKNLKHARVTMNAQRLANGKELTPESRKQILTFIGNSPREYRGAYALVMDKPEYAVPKAEAEAYEAALEEGVKKYGLAEIEGADDIKNASVEKRSKIAKYIENEKLREQVKSGKLKADADLDGLYEHLEGIIKADEKKIQDIEDESQEILSAISDAQQRELLKKYDELQMARAKYPNKSTKTARDADRGMKMAENYKSGVLRNAKANYDTIYRQIKDLEKITEITAEVKKAIELKEQKANILETVADRKAEAQAVKDLKELRKKLVKRAMRRVDFNKIDYNYAKSLIAVQRVFEPNLEGGINRWIGTEGAEPRLIWSEYYTDEAARKRIQDRLKKSNGKTATEILRLLDETDTEEKFNAWTKKQRQWIYKFFGTKDWIKELGLDKLADEREEAIQLPIEIAEDVKLVTDAKGKQKAMVMGRAVFGDEVETMIRDVLGADLYDNVVHRPFAEWTINQMEDFAKKVDDWYVEGREKLKARKEAEKQVAQELRDKIIKSIKNTGIVINDDDDDKTKERKLKKIAKILGKSQELKGSAASKYEKQNILQSIFQSYGAMNVRRFARMLDDYQEGVNTDLLYWSENDAYNAQERAKERRQTKIAKALKDSGLDLADLQKQITIKDFEPGRDITLSIDELLYYWKASEEKTSRDAVMYGCLVDEKDREIYKKINDDFINDNRTREENLTKAIQEGDKQAEAEYRKTMELGKDEDGDTILPGTGLYMERCKGLYDKVIDAAEQILKYGTYTQDLDEKQKHIKEYLQRLKETGDDAEAQKEALKGKPYYDFAQAIAQDYNEEFDRLEKVSIDEFNQPVWRVGHYLPLVRLSILGDTNENKVRSDLLSMTSDANGQRGVDKGMTVKRIKINPLYQAPVEAGLYKTWAEQVDRTEHFIAYAGYTRMLNRVYRNRDSKAMQGWMESRYGRGAVRYLGDYINEVANPDAGTTTDALSRFMKAFRGKTAPAYLSWKLSSILKQAVTSPAPFMQFIAPHRYIAACFKMIAHPQRMEELIKSKSVFMRDRRFDPIADLINDEVKKNNQSKLAYAWAKFSQTGMAGLEWIDWACVAPGWYAIYEDQKAKLEKAAGEKYDEEITKLREENEAKEIYEQLEDELLVEEAERRAEMDPEIIERKAIEYADDCTRLSQPSNRKVDLSPIFKNGSEAQKALLQFTTSLNVIWQNIRYDLPQAVRTKQYGQALGIIAGYTMAGVALGVLAGDLDGGDDDEDKKVKRLIFDATTQFSDAIPVIGSTITSLNERVITGRSSFGSTGTDLFPTLTRAIQGTTAFTQRDWEKALEKYAEAVGLFMGAPVSGAKELLYAAGIGDGEEGLEFKPEAVLGRRD